MVVVVVVVATPLAGAVPESKLYGQAFEEALAPDTDPIVFVGAPVGRSEPIAFADKLVAVALMEVVAKISAGCAVTHHLLVTNLSFLRCWVRRGQPRLLGCVLNSRRLGLGDLADLFRLALRN